MIYLFHGSDLSESRQALVELKLKYDSSAVITLNGKKLDKEGFLRAVESRSIFSSRTLVVIEKIPDMRRTKFLTEILESLSEAVDVAFWSENALKATHSLVKFVTKAGGKVFHFMESVPKNIFPFLDALGFKNKKRAFLELHRLLKEGSSPIYLHLMIIYQIRNLLRAKFGDAKGIHPFVIRKLKSQINNFEERELINAYKTLFEADVALKTSQRDPVLVLDQLVTAITS